MKKSLFSTPAVVAASLAVWLGVCLYLEHVKGQYDGAILSNTYYFWMLAPIQLFCSRFITEDQQIRRGSRLNDAICFLALTGIAFYFVQGGKLILYNLYFWWFFALIASTLILSLYRIAKGFQKPRSLLWSTAILELELYLSLAVSCALYLAVLQPVSVDAITSIGQAEGGRFIGCLTGDRARTPLGVYWFSDDESDAHWCYDVLTGELVSDTAFY